MRSLSVSDGPLADLSIPSWYQPALFMSASATIADPLLRRAFGQRARPSDPHRTWGQAPFCLAPVPVLRAGQALPQTAEPVPWPPRAGLATRLSDFATNRHE